MKTQTQHLGRHRPAPQAEQRPGTVLVLVVALLGLLFVAGAAFLGTVAFESQSITSQQEVRDETSLIDAIETQIYNEMNRAWLGDNGVPYTNDLTSSSENSGAWQLDKLVDVYGEVAGLHPLVAPIEPFYDGVANPLLYAGSTDLELARQGLPWNRAWESYGDYDNKPADADDMPLTEYPIGSGIKRVPADFPGAGLGTDHDMLAPTAIRDADGDGISESLPRRLRKSLFAYEARRRMADQVSDPEVDVDLLSANGMTQDDLFVSVRIVPHSGMASVSGSHNAILNAVIGPNYINLNLNGYVPATEEPALRNRGFLPGRVRAPSMLVDEHLRLELLVPLDVGPGVDEVFRWWPMDPNDAASEYAAWVGWVASGAANRRHLVTTVSHDENLLRGGMPDPDNATPNGLYDPEWTRQNLASNNRLWSAALYPADDSGIDWTEGTSNVDDPAFIGEFRGGLLSLGTNFITPRANLDPRVGRMKLHLPSLDGPIKVPGGDHNHLNRPTLRELNTVRDFFTLMLRNVLDFNGDGVLADPAEYSAQDDQAAQLAANLWDFADDATDGRENSFNELTRIVSASGKIYYGVERQPFITEIYSWREDKDGSSTNGLEIEVEFIELFNPHHVAISLDRYQVKVGGATAYTFGSLDVLPAGGYAVIVDEEGDFVATDPSAIEYPASFTLTNTSDVDLEYRYDLLPHDGGSGSTYVVVDRFRPSSSGSTYGEVVGTFGTDPSPIPGDKTATLERYINDANFETRFTAVVPYYGETAGTLTTGTPGLANGYIPTAPWAPVHAITSDKGNMAEAMPTTGSLLLLMRYAHEDNGGVLTPFNDKLRHDTQVTGALAGSGGGVAVTAVDQRQMMDNGHMPTFGTIVFPSGPPGTFVAEMVHPANAPAAAGSSVRGQGLEIPWGQLIFDYFTALPMANTYNPGAGLAFTVGVFNTTSPTVDQSGLRVHGRVNINAAPWKVLAGVPRAHVNKLPVYQVIESQVPNTFPQIADTASPDANTLGPDLAKAIVAYRERRQIAVTGGNTSDFSTIPDAGFLSVGELVFASGPDGTNGSSFDNNEPSNARPDYLQAAARLVALSDWVTTRGHVFTIYGHIRGVGQREAVDRRSIRFQETVDRLPSMLDGQPPQRIGRRIVGSYSDARSD